MIPDPDAPALVSPVQQEAAEEEKVSNGAEAVKKAVDTVQVKKEEGEDMTRPLTR